MNPCTSGDGSNESKREVENIPWPIATTKLEHWGLNTPPLACEADVEPLRHWFPLRRAGQ